MFTCSHKTITIGTKFKVANLFTGEEFTYRLVLPEDGSLEEGLLSIHDPLGSILLDRGEGEIIDFPFPQGGVYVRVEQIMEFD